MKKQTQDEIWFGLAGVIQPVGVDTLEDALGAFVNVLGKASSKRDFRKRVVLALASLDLNLERIESVRPFMEQMKMFEVSQDLMDLFGLAKETGQIHFDTFFTYDEV